MISISPMNSRIREMKIDFLTFAWAKPYVVSLRKFEGILKTFESKDSLLNLNYFDTNLKGAVDCRKKF